MGISFLSTTVVLNVMGWPPKAPAYVLWWRWPEAACRMANGKLIPISNQDHFCNYDSKLEALSGYVITSNCIILIQGRIACLLPKVSHALWPSGAADASAPPAETRLPKALPPRLLQKVRGCRKVPGRMGKARQMDGHNVLYKKIYIYIYIYCRPY